MLAAKLLVLVIYVFICLAAAAKGVTYNDAELDFLPGFLVALFLIPIVGAVMAVTGTVMAAPVWLMFVL